MRVYAAGCCYEPQLPAPQRCGRIPRRSSEAPERPARTASSNCLNYCSADDHLCDGAKLDELVGAKRAAGQRVSARRWQRSQHCGHFRRHREEYSQLLLDFLAGLHSEAGAPQAGGSGSGSGGGGGAGLPPGGGPRSRL